MGLNNYLNEGAARIIYTFIWVALVDGQCNSDSIHECMNPLFSYKSKDAFPDLLDFAQSFTDNQIADWCSKISNVEICLTKHKTCAEDTGLTIDAVLDVANFVCQSNAQGDTEKWRECTFNQWNSETRECHDNYVLQGADGGKRSKCKAIEAYVDCVKNNVKERCQDGSSEWIEATMNHYIVPQAQQIYMCDIDYLEDEDSVSLTVVLLAIFIPLIIVVAAITTCVVVRHQRNQKQIKKSLTAISLVSQLSRESQSKSAPPAGECQRHEKDDVYVSLSTDGNQSTQQKQEQPLDVTTPLATAAPEAEFSDTQGERDNDERQKIYPTLS